MLDDIIKNSRIMNSPLLLDIKNTNGRNWSQLGLALTSANDLKARIGTISTPWSRNSYNLFPVPKLKFINDQLCDIIDDRVNELFKIAKEQNKKIAIMWSGGIDSTTILSGFIKNLSTSDLENIVIFLSLSSINENVSFYKDYILNKIKFYSVHELHLTDDFLSNHILLTGDPADCLFGPIMYQDLIETKGHYAPWKNNIKYIIDRINHDAVVRCKMYPTLVPSPTFGKWWVDKVSNNLLEESPAAIDSISDWWWWYFFNFKFECNVLRPFYIFRDNFKYSISAESTNSYVKYAFFNTDRFQHWSYSNLKNHVPTLYKHKFLAKKYIFELDHNQEYFENKTKTYSTPYGYHQSLDWPVIFDENWIGHYIHDPGVTDKLTDLLETYKG